MDSHDSAIVYFVLPVCIFAETHLQKSAKNLQKYLQRDQICADLWKRDLNICKGTKCVQISRKETYLQKRDLNICEGSWISEAKYLQRTLKYVEICRILGPLQISGPFADDMYVSFHGLTLNTLQHTVAHCNTLQHTATHCNTHTKHLKTSAKNLQKCLQRDLNIWKICRDLQIFTQTADIQVPLQIFRSLFMDSHESVIFQILGPLQISGPRLGYSGPFAEI